MVQVTRASLRIAVACMLAASAVVLPAPRASAMEPPGSPGAPVLDPASLDYSHLRVTATANSGWAAGTFAGLEIIDHVLVSGPTVSVTSSQFAWGMGLTASTVVLDLLVASPDAQATSLTTTKGDAGTFTVDADAVSADDVATDAFTVVNSGIGQPAQNALLSNLSRPALFVDGGLDVGPIDEERLVMAVVHPWWEATDYSDIAPDKPVTPWQSDVLADVEDQVDLMADAGIDVAIYSYGWADYATDPNIDNLLSAVSDDSRMQVAPLIEMEALSTPSCTPLEVLLGCVSHPVINFTHMRAVVGAAMDDVAAEPGLFLHRDGRPVMFFYGDWWLDTYWWNQLVGQFVADGHDVFPITHVEDTGRESDGYWQYMVDPANTTEAQYTAHSRGRTLRTRLHPLLTGQEQRLVVGTAWPGYDDQSRNRPVDRVEPRGVAGAFYDTRWTSALRGLPDWVVITSWNEWWEQTHIAPSVAGTTALDQTTDWADVFHGS